MCTHLSPSAPLPPTHKHSQLQLWFPRGISGNCPLSKITTQKPIFHLSAFFPWKGNKIPTFGGVPKAVSLARLGITSLAPLTKPQYLLLDKFIFEKQEPTVLLKYKAKLSRKQRSLRVCEQ